MDPAFKGQITGTYFSLQRLQETPDLYTQELVSAMVQLNGAPDHADEMSLIGIRTRRGTLLQGAADLCT